MIIKFVLLGAAVLLGVLILRERVPGQHLALRRILGLVVVALGIAAVLWPGLTTVVANALGVGRGTDLLLYVLVVVFVYSTVATTQRVHQLERELLAVTRRLALLTPRPPGASDHVAAAPKAPGRD